MTTTATTATTATTSGTAAEAAALAAAAAAAPPADDQMVASSSDGDDSGDDESESDLDSLPWLLGFVEPPTSPLSLLRHHFRSKVGGRPAWLDPCRLPTPAQLCCGVTGSPLDFLCQVYAPLDESETDDDDEEEEDEDEDRGPRRQRQRKSSHEDAFHRAVFVFVGPSGSALGNANEPALGNRSVRALRCQLPRSNAHYSPHPPPRDGCPPPRLVDPSSVSNPDRWRVAECEALIVAAAAEAAAAAGGTGQVAAAEAEAAASAAAAEFAASGGARGGGAAGPPLRLFPEGELVVEEEGSDCGSDLEEAVAAAERAMRTTAAKAMRATTAKATKAAVAAAPPTPAQKLGRGRHEEEEEGAAADAADDVDKGVDAEEEEEADAEMMDSVEAAVHPDAAAMARFSARVARAPSQVLRYRFDRRRKKQESKRERGDASAIWPRASPKPPSSVPPCSNCGARRALEFQLLPQMLNFLGCDAADEEAPDWSCVGVWSCVESCSRKAEEGGISNSSPSSLLPVSKTGGAGVSGGPSAYIEEFVWVQPSDAQQGAS